MSFLLCKIISSFAQKRALDGDNDMENNILRLRRLHCPMDPGTIPSTSMSTASSTTKNVQVIAPAASEVISNKSIVRWFAELPEELKDEIFCHADFFTQIKIRRICRYWNYLLRDVENAVHIHLSLSQLLTSKLPLKKEFPAVRQLTLQGHFREKLTDIPAPAFQSIIHACSGLNHIIFQNLVVSGDVPAHFWPDLMKEAPLQRLIRQKSPVIRVSAVGLRVDLTICGPARPFQPLYVDKKWSVLWRDVSFRDYTKFSTAITAAINGIWWSYSDEQKEWLRGYARLLKNDHFWSDWVQNDGNFQGSPGIMSLLLSEVPYGDLTALPKAEAPRILLSMAVFILRRGTLRSIRDVTPPPQPFPF